MTAVARGDGSARPAPPARPRPIVRFEHRWDVGGAWLLAVAAELTGRGSLVNHDQLIHGGLPRPVALVLFLIAWQAMVAAMMLPSALPLIRLFDRASAAQPRVRPGRVVASYVLVWTGSAGPPSLLTSSSTRPSTPAMASLTLP
jgi:hypothetical protein